MLHTVISLNDIFYDKFDDCVDNATRNNGMSSTNPFDYISDGYHIDYLEYFGGDNNVSFKCDIYGNFASNNNGSTNK